jgi:hypothetical protein
MHAVVLFAAVLLPCPWGGRVTPGLACEHLRCTVAPTTLTNELGQDCAKTLW